MKLSKKMLTSPVTIFSAIFLGIVVGLRAPELAPLFKLIGDIYAEMMKMLILPFLVSSIILSVNRLVRDPKASQYLGKIILCLLAGMFSAAVIAAVFTAIAAPGSNLDEKTIQSFGRLVQSDASNFETTIQLFQPAVHVPEERIVNKMIMRMVPENIFQALSSGDTLKVMSFTLMFSIAMGAVGREKSRGFIEGCELVFSASQNMTIWLSYLLPLATFALMANQIAANGLEAFKVMGHYLLAHSLSALFMISICVLLIWRKSGKSFMKVLRALSDPFFMAIVTRSSVTCMPIMMKAMHEKLGFNKSMSELLVPLGIAMFRVGPTMYYVMTTIFIAQLYGRHLAFADYTVIVFASIMVGISSVGMGSIVLIMQTAVVCSLLGLPFEAVFILFVAADAISDTNATLVNVFATQGLVAAIATNEHAEDAVPIQDVAALAKPA